MFIPFFDTKFSTRDTPVFTIVLVLLNCLIFVIAADSLTGFFGLEPSKILINKNLYTFITSLFLHASFWHLLTNMWFLWLFGDNIEHNLGKLKFIIFYLFCGVVANAGYSLLASEKTIPLVGASGAISGLLGAYLVLYPGNRIEGLLVLVPFYFKRITIDAKWFLGLWFILQLLAAYFLTGDLTAYSVHIIGFLTGFACVKFFI